MPRSGRAWRACRRRALDAQRCAKCEGPVLTHPHHIDQRRALLLTAVEPFDWMAPEGQLRAIPVSSSGVALSGWIHSPDTLGTKTSGRSRTQCREWMHFFDSKRMTARLPRTVSMVSAMFTPVQKSLEEPVRCLVRRTLGVDQFDVIDAMRAPGQPADLMHQFEQYRGVSRRGSRPGATPRCSTTKRSSVRCTKTATPTGRPSAETANRL